MRATAGAVFTKLQPLGVIPAVLGGSICPLPAPAAGKTNNDSSFSFFGHVLLKDTANTTRAYRSTPLPNSKADALLQGYRVNKSYLHGYVVTGHYHFHPFR